MSEPTLIKGAWGPYTVLVTDEKTYVVDSEMLESYKSAGPVGKDQIEKSSDITVDNSNGKVLHNRYGADERQTS